MVLKAVLQGRIAAPNAERLGSRLGANWRIESWDPRTNEPGEFASMAADATAIIGGAIPLPNWPAVPQLQLFQIPWAGYEFCRPSSMPAGVPVCNCFEHETGIAEYVLLAMLEWQVGLRTMDARFRAKGWDGHGPGMSHFHGELKGRTLGILGYGHIGREVAMRARAFGMRCLGTRRQADITPPELDWLGTTDDLPRLLAESDFLLIACDLNKATRGLIDAAALASMKPDSVVINVARGGIINETALFEALRERRIGGAVIDVWYNYPKPDEVEPWPANLPFHELDNVILSAHECAWTHELIERRWDFVATNLERVAAGEPPHNIVFHGEQVPDSA